MVEAPSIDKVIVNCADAQAEERADLWADAVRPFYDVSLIGQPAATHMSSASIWLLDSVMLFEAAFDGQVIHRHKRHFCADVAPLLLLEIFISRVSCTAS